MVLNSSPSLSVDLSGSQWFSIVSSGSPWFPVALRGSYWFSMVLSPLHVCLFLLLLPYSFEPCPLGSAMHSQ